MRSVSCSDVHQREAHSLVLSTVCHLHHHQLRRILHSNDFWRYRAMDVLDSAAQAGSIRLQLASSEQSSSNQDRFAEWTEISNVSDTPITFARSVDVSLFASLVRLSAGQVGRRPHRRPIIHAYCKTYRDSLVVRVHLTPCVGPFDPLKASFRKDLEAVLGKLVRRWEWVVDADQGMEEEELVFGNKV